MQGPPSQRRLLEKMTVGEKKWSSLCVKGGGATPKEGGARGSSWTSPLPGGVGGLRRWSRVQRAGMVSFTFTWKDLLGYLECEEGGPGETSDA